MFSSLNFSELFRISNFEFRIFCRDVDGPFAVHEIKHKNGPCSLLFCRAQPSLDLTPPRGV